MACCTLSALHQSPHESRRRGQTRRRTNQRQAAALKRRSKLSNLHAGRLFRCATQRRGSVGAWVDSQQPAAGAGWQQRGRREDTAVKHVVCHGLQTQTRPGGLASAWCGWNGRGGVRHGAPAGSRRAPAFGCR